MQHLEVTLLPWLNDNAHELFTPSISKYPQPTETYTNSKQGDNIPQGLCYIWAKTLRQGIYLVPAQIVAFTKIFYFHPITSSRLHLVHLEINDLHSASSLVTFLCTIFSTRGQKSWFPTLRLSSDKQFWQAILRYKDIAIKQ